MRLIDLLEVLADDVMLTIWSAEDRYLGCSDGKDSIDEKYNNCKVVVVRHSEKSIEAVLEVIA